MNKTPNRLIAFAAKICGQVSRHFSPESSGILGEKKAQKRGQVSRHFRQFLVLYDEKSGGSRHFRQFLVLYGEKTGGSRKVVIFNCFCVTYFLTLKITII